MTIWQVQDLLDEAARERRAEQIFEIALSGQEPVVVMGRYQALEKAFEKGNRIDGFMEKLAEQRHEREASQGA